MKHLRSAAILTMFALAVPTAGFAQSTPPKSQKATKTKPATAATTTMKGVVKVTEATLLTIALSSTKGTEETFILNSATERHGELAVGATVNIRYRYEDGKKVATIVNVQPKRKSATSKIRK